MELIPQFHSFLPWPLVWGISSLDKFGIVHVIICSLFPCQSRALVFLRNTWQIVVYSTFSFFPYRCSCLLRKVAGHTFSWSCSSWFGLARVNQNCTYCFLSSFFQTAWWKYIIVSVIDATANCLIVKAYEYTTILSVMLCDAMCIPSTVVISLIFLHTKFGWRHYVGVFLCLLGLAVMLISDFLGGDSGTHRIVGDVMALCGSVLYAVSNVCQEVLVKHDDWVVSMGGCHVARVSGNGGTRRQCVLAHSHRHLRTWHSRSHSLGCGDRRTSAGVRAVPLRHVRPHCSRCYGSILTRCSCRPTTLWCSTCISWRRTWSPRSSPSLSLMMYHCCFDFT